MAAGVTPSILLAAPICRIIGALNRATKKFLHTLAVAIRGVKVGRKTFQSSLLN